MEFAVIIIISLKNLMGKILPGFIKVLWKRADDNIKPARGCDERFESILLDVTKKERGFVVMVALLDRIINDRLPLTGKTA